MQEIEVQSTSRNTAECSPISIRETEQVRLVFIPTLVKNEINPEASIRGRFIYQRKNKKNHWDDATKIPLSTLKSGEGFMLELHSLELLTLLRSLRPLYKIYKQQGIPLGHSTFVKLEASLAKFFELEENDLTKFLESHSSDALTTFLKLLKWISTSPQGNITAQKIAKMAPEQFPGLSALIGLSAIKDALNYWTENKENSSEEFWQNALTNRSFVLSQVFAYPVVLINSKAYVGGKQIDNKGGNIIDFLATVESTDSVVLIEIKTPTTKLLGPQYRNEVFPFSNELSGAIAQVLRYRQSLMQDFHSITSNHSNKIITGEPKCLVVAGNASKELTDNVKKENFELQRDRLQGISVISYDELFRRIERLVSLLENTTL